MYRMLFFSLIVGLLCSVNLKAQMPTEVVEVKDKWINAGETKTFTSDKVWLLKEFVFVEEGATLIIEPGTVIWGGEGQGDDACGLIIARGGKIMAEGSSEKPIIFTMENDDPYDDYDNDITISGQWGGVIILGKSQINTPGGVGQIEGISSDEPRGQYGGGDSPDLRDNSGIFAYVSIRHGGTDIGANNEINGLTMGAVGGGTTIHHVEVFRNADDGFEWFGGTVDTKYLVSAFNADDSFDWDEGFRGQGQFWFSIQSEDAGNNAGENDGATKPEDSKPYAMPSVYNATFIGSGAESGWSKSQIAHFRDNSGGTYANCVFTETGGKGIEIEDVRNSDGSESEAEDSRKRLEAGDISITNNIWWNIGSTNTTLDDIVKDYSVKDNEGNVIFVVDQSFVKDYLAGTGTNWIENPNLMSISRQVGMKMLEPWDESGVGPIFMKERAAMPSDFFTEVEYIGAFGGDNWLAGWTLLDMAGYLGELSPQSVESGIQHTISASVYPNPTPNHAYLHFTLNESEQVAILIYDGSGQLVGEIADTYLHQGKHEVNVDLSTYASGRYFLKISTSSGFNALPVQIMR